MPTCKNLPLHIPYRTQGKYIAPVLHIVGITLCLSEDLWSTHSALPFVVNRWLALGTSGVPKCS